MSGEPHIPPTPPLSLPPCSPSVLAGIVPFNYTTVLHEGDIVSHTLQKRKVRFTEVKYAANVRSKKENNEALGFICCAQWLYRFCIEWTMSWVPSGIYQCLPIMRNKQKSIQLLTVVFKFCLSYLKHGWPLKGKCQASGNQDMSTIEFINLYVT